MNSLVDPAMSVLLFFEAGERPEDEADALCQPWLHSPRLTLAEETVGSENRHYLGQRADGTHCRLDYCLVADTHLLRLVLIRPGAHTPVAWNELTGLLNEAAELVWSHADYPRPWAATRFHLGLLSPRAASQEAERLACAPEGPALDTRAAGHLDRTPFGWLGEASDQQAVLRGTPAHLRCLLLLTPEDRAAEVRAKFLGPMDQGPTRIELYLHKALHHARLYGEPVSSADRLLPAKSARDDLEGTRQALEAASQKALATLAASQVRLHRAALESVAGTLILFLTQKGRAEVLLNSLETNLHMVREHMDRVRLQSSLYERHVRRLERRCEQIRTDLRYAEATLSAVQTIQDIERGEEAMRLDRSSFLLSGAAAVLAGVAIFNSFIDIWGQTVAGTGLALPAPWLRVVLGLAAAVGAPFAAYWVAERRLGRAVLALAVVLAAVALAVVSTMWANP